MKRTLAILIALAMSVMMLTACGSKDGTSGTPDNSGDANQTSTGSYPGNKNITLYCGYSAGGSSDTLCRLLAAKVGEKLGTTVTVENVTGASGWVMWNQMMESTKPDGYSFFLINSPNVTTGKYDPDNTMKYDQNDFEMICNEVTDSNCLAIRVDDDRYSDWDSFAAYWKQAGSLITSASGLGITSDDATADMLVANDLGVDVDIIASGGSREKCWLSFQEYFEKIGADPVKWGKPFQSLLGGLKAQLELGCAAIGGKDSMSGSFEDIHVPPTLISFAVSTAKAQKVVTDEFKAAGDKVYYLAPEYDENGLPVYESVRAVFDKMESLIDAGKVKAVYTLGMKGLGEALCKMAFGSKLGFTFAQGLDAATLFAPYEGSFVVEIPEDGVLADSLAPYATALGTVNGNGIFILDGDVLTADELIAAWSSKLESVFPTDSGKSATVEDVPLYKERSIFVSQNKVARPRVFIPAFPGTNCEVDTARAFEQAGADPHILVVGNLTPAAINETIEKMVEEIKQAQIVMLPGGFSGGDEPEGSGKFIATTFRNPAVAEAVTQLLNCRDGLMLGICNGFQALIKLGLVPYGKIVNIQENDPTLTFNTIGRHISQMAYTRVTSTKSPWLAGTQAGDMFAVPISHGEGRFVADEATLRRLAENGQIATQYVDPDGNVATDMPFNPNGSVWAVEGITSPDGRVLGKMGHCERKGENLYKNVPFNKDMQIFESGVKYFK